MKSLLYSIISVVQYLTWTSNFSGKLKQYCLLFSGIGTLLCHFSIVCLFGLLAGFLNFETNRILSDQLVFARLGSPGWEAWNTVFLSRRTALLYQRPFIQFKMASVEAFECDPDFCPRCGSILPLPGLLEVVSCTLCNFQKDTSGKSIKNFLIQIKAMSWVSLSNMHVQRVGSVDRVQNTRKTRLVPTKPMSC